MSFDKLNGFEIKKSKLGLHYQINKKLCCFLFVLTCRTGEKCIHKNNSEIVDLVYRITN